MKKSSLFIILGILFAILGLTGIGITAMVGIICYGRAYFYDGYFYTAVLTTLFIVFITIGVLLFIIGLTQISNKSDANNPTVIRYKNLIVHGLLLIFTFGIYELVWIYRMTSNTNGVGEHRGPLNKTLLCLFIPFYEIYWIYITSQRVDTMISRHGINQKTDAANVFFAFFIPFVPQVIIQHTMNQIVMLESQNNK